MITITILQINTQKYFTRRAIARWSREIRSRVTVTPLFNFFVLKYTLNKNPQSFSTTVLTVCKAVKGARDLLEFAEAKSVILLIKLCVIISTPHSKFDMKIVRFSQL